MTLILNRVDRECREVARVDHLERIGGRARRDELTATRGARGPVGEAIGVVVGADDETGPDDGRAARQGLLHRLLAQRLQRSVGFAVHFLDGFIGEFAHRRVFVARHAEIRIHRDRRHEHVLLHLRRQQLRREPHMARHVARVVDDHVPFAILEPVDLAIAIALDAFDLGITIRLGLAAIEEGERMATLQRQRRHVQADEARSAEDEDLQRLRLFGRPRRAARRAARARGGEGKQRASFHAHLLD